MAESTVLSMKFRNTDNKTTTLSVNDAKTDLTESVVRGAMNTIVAENIFSNDGAEMAAAVGAVITQKTETVLF